MAVTFEPRSGESLFAQCKGDTWKTPGDVLSNQVSGRFFFTDQRIVFRTWGPFKKSLAYDIKIKNIAYLEKYTIAFFIPTGIRVVLQDGKNYKISVMKRKKYIEYLAQFIG